MAQQPYYQEPLPAEKPVPGASAVPNGSVAAYPHSHSQAAPGAVGKWSFGLCDCCCPVSTCCLATWCPCILYGKTYAREHGDPDSNGVNSNCLAYYLLTCIGGACIIQFIGRGATRERYGIQGSTCGDFCAAWCCGCCVLVQEEKDSIVRNTGINPKTKEPYVSPDQMAYP